MSEQIGTITVTRTVVTTIPVFDTDWTFDVNEDYPNDEDMEMVEARRCGTEEVDGPFYEFVLRAVSDGAG